MPGITDVEESYAQPGNALGVWDHWCIHAVARSHRLADGYRVEKHPRGVLRPRFGCRRVLTLFGRDRKRPGLEVGGRASRETASHGALSHYPPSGGGIPAGDYVRGSRPPRGCARAPRPAPPRPRRHLRRPKAGDPIQYDELRIEHDQGEGEIVVFDRAILLLRTDDEAVRRIHQVCCGLDDFATRHRRT